MLKTLTSLCLLLAVPSISFAQEWPALDNVPAVAQTGQNDVALLIGVDDYLFVPDVKGARTNINDWARFLREGLGVSQVTTLANEQATREEILAAAETAAAAAGPDSTLWVVFVGHGAPTTDGKDGFLLGVDTQQTLRSLEARGIKRSELLDVLNTGQQRQAFVVLDACFSGADANGEALVKGVQPVVAPQPFEPADNRTAVMTAAKSSEVAGALPNAERPAFSYLLLGAMRGWAAGDDSQVTVAEAVAFARHELEVVPGRRQTPSATGGVEFVLATGVSEARPQTVVSAPTESAQVVAKAPATLEPVDAVSRVRLHVAAGAGGELAYETGTPLLDAGVGFRLGTGGTNFGLTAGLGFTHVTNAHATEAVDQQNAQFREDNIDVQVALNDGTKTSLLDVGLGPRLEIRSGRLTTFGEVRAGIALPIGGECQTWDAAASQTSGEAILLDCATRRGGTGLAVTPRLGVSYGVLEVAAMAKFLPRSYTEFTVSNGQVEEQEGSKTLFVAGLTIGVAFDL